MAKFWIVTKDPGGHNSVWPISEELKRRNHAVLDIANGKAIEIFAAKKVPHIAIHNIDPRLLLDSDWMRLPDVFITSMCSEGGVGLDLIPVMGALEIPTVAVCDLWGGSLKTEFADPMCWPDLICVQDTLAKEMVLDAWDGYKEHQVQITGQVSADSLVDIDTAAVALIKHIKRNIQNWPVVTFAGQLEKSGVTLSRLIRALNKLPHKVFLLPLKHPRLYDNAPEEAPIWEEALSDFVNGEILDREEFSAEEWVTASDVVTSMFSTVLSTAAYFKKECIAILFPEEGEARLIESGLDFLPMERLGSCIVARNEDQLEQYLLQALSRKGLGLGKTQEKNFKLDGGSASRAADVVEGLL